MDCIIIFPQDRRLLQGRRQHQPPLFPPLIPPVNHHSSDFQRGLRLRRPVHARPCQICQTPFNHKKIWCHGGIHWPRQNWTSPSMSGCSTASQCHIPLMPWLQHHNSYCHSTPQKQVGHNLQHQDHDRNTRRCPYNRPDYWSYATIC